VVSQFWVLYRDRRTQLIPANRWDPAGANYVFNLGGVETIIAKAAVESFMFDDIPEPEQPPAQPKPSFGSVRRHSWRDVA
jgi:hypothetical protein